jgi:hypothetical protein
MGGCMSRGCAALQIGQLYPDAVEQLKRQFPKRAIITHAVKDGEADYAVIRDTEQIHVLYDSVSNIVKRVQE